MENKFQLPCNVTYVMLKPMPLGKSNRVVVDLELREKRDLHAALAKDGLTLKEWFNDNMRRYLRERQQLQLFKDKNGEQETLR